jgi:AcrR family transcriptional regulator
MGRDKKILDPSIVIMETLRLIEAKGLAAFSTRNLAASLGVSAMTLYNYFENRGAILREAMLRGFDSIWEGIPESMERSIASTGSPLSIFRVIAERLIWTAVHRPKLYQFLFESKLERFRGDDRILERFWAAFKLVEPYVIDAGAIGDMHRDVYLFEVLANGLATNLQDGEEDITEERYRELVEVAYQRFIAPHEDDLRTYEEGASGAVDS